MTTHLERAARLACWKGAVAPEPLGGGITNVNFVVEDAGERYVVRIGEDIPEHGVYRVNELAAAQAAHAAGISPEIVHAEPGALVMRWVDGRTLDPAGVREPACLERILDTVGRCHREIPLHFRGPTPIFRVFQVVRDYARTLREDGSRMAGRIDEFLGRAAHLESVVGPVESVAAWHRSVSGTDAAAFHAVQAAPKNAAPAACRVGTASARSRYSFRISQEVSATRVQPWQAAPYLEGLGVPDDVQAVPQRLDHPIDLAAAIRQGQHADHLWKPGVRGGADQQPTRLPALLVRMASQPGSRAPALPQREARKVHRLVHAP